MREDGMDGLGDGLGNELGDRLVDKMYSDAAQQYSGLESSIAVGLKSDGRQHLYNPVDKTNNILDNYGHAAVVSCRNIASLTFQDHDLRVDAFAKSRPGQTRRKGQ